MGTSKQSQLDKRDAKAGAARRRSENAKKDVWVGFFDVPFPPDQDEDFDRWQADNETEIWEMIGAAAEAGWKTSVAYNEKAGGFVASMTGLLREAAGGVESVTAWAGDAQESVMLLYYKLYVVCGMSWDNATAENTASRPRRG